MKAKTILLLLLSLLLSTTINAQKSSKITITGKVIDASKRPIVNAIIMIDNEKTNSVTDAAGNYKIKVRADAKRIGIFTFGHGLKEEDIAGRTQIDFNFGGGASEVSGTKDIPASETAVDVGYSSEKAKNIGSDTYIKDPHTKKKTYSTIYEMLQEVPGVSVNGTSVNIRDSKNLWGTIPPLFVVDGVYTEDPSVVSPNMVESISILKGSSAAMYGSRGYGGVILIKTKKPEYQKT